MQLRGTLDRSGTYLPDYERVLGLVSITSLTACSGAFVAVCTGAGRCFGALQRSGARPRG